MPNPAKRLLQISPTFTIDGIDHLHKYYLRGFSQAIASSEEVRKSAEMIAGLEEILLRSGYLTAGEIRERHIALGIVAPQRVGVA